MRERATQKISPCGRVHHTTSTRYIYVQHIHTFREKNEKLAKINIRNIKLARFWYYILLKISNYGHKYGLCLFGPNSRFFL